MVGGRRGFVSCFHLLGNPLRQGLTTYAMFISCAERYHTCCLLYSMNYPLYSMNYPFITYNHGKSNVYSIGAVGTVGMDANTLRA